MKMSATTDSALVAGVSADRRRQPPDATRDRSARDIRWPSRSAAALGTPRTRTASVATSLWPTTATTTGSRPRPGGPGTTRVPGRPSDTDGRCSRRRPTSDGRRRRRSATRRPARDRRTGDSRASSRPACSPGHWPTGPEHAGLPLPGSVTSPTVYHNCCPDRTR